MEEVKADKDLIEKLDKLESLFNEEEIPKCDFCPKACGNNWCSAKAK